LLHNISTGSGSDLVKPLESRKLISTRSLPLPVLTRSKNKLNLRSRCKHKAWGASPRDRIANKCRARETGDSVLRLSPAIAGSAHYCHVNLGLAPQALCLHLLRRLFILLHPAAQVVYWPYLLRRSKTSHTSKELEAHSFNAGIQFSKESVILRLCKDSTPCFLKVAPVSGYFF